MKYSIIEVVNGNFVIRSEGITSIESGKAQFHGRCQALWNAPDVITACVMLSDETLNFVDGCKEFIHHEIEAQE